MWRKGICRVIVRHFKGDLYKVVDEAVHTETYEQLVIYKSLKNGQVFARPKGMFYSKVDKSKYPDVKQEYRFEDIDKIMREKLQIDQKERLAKSYDNKEI